MSNPLCLHRFRYTCLVTSRAQSGLFADETPDTTGFITAFCGKLQPPNSAFTNGDPTAEAAMEAEINALRIKFDALRTQRAQP